MNEFKIVLTKVKDVANFVRSFGESMALLHGSSLIASDAEIDATSLQEDKMLLTGGYPLRTLCIYFRKHGTFTNFYKDPSSDFEFWKNQAIGILKIEHQLKSSKQKRNTYTIYWEQI